VALLGEKKTSSGGNSRDKKDMRKQVGATRRLQEEKKKKYNWLKGEIPNNPAILVGGKPHLITKD